MRLLPIVLFAATALLGLKLVGLATGVGSFGPGPQTAQAAGDEENSGATIDRSAEKLLMPVDLAAEAEALKKKSKPPEPAEAHGEAAAEGEAPADADAKAASEGEAPEEDAPPDEAGADKADAGDEMAVTPQEASTDGAAPPEAGNEAASEGEAAAEGEDAAQADAPAEGDAPADAHGDAPADAHGEAPAGAKVTTERPAEYTPGDNTSETAVLQSLARRREELDKREADIQMRMKLLEAAETRLKQRVDELKGIEAQLATPENLSRKDEEEAARLKGLAVMYENMKPKAAAKVFDGLEMNVLLPLARQMNPRKLSAVLAVMSADRAAQLTVAMAGDLDPQEIVIRRGDDLNATAVPSVDSLPKIMPAGEAQPGG